MASERALHATTWDAGPEGAEARDAGPQVAAPRIVLVHGFTQTGASWSLIARELATDSEVVAPDLPGHGRSPAPDAGSGTGRDGRARRAGGGQGDLHRVLARRTLLPATGPAGTAARGAARPHRGASGHRERDGSPAAPGGRRGARGAARARRRRGHTRIRRVVALGTALLPLERGAGRPAVASHQLGRRACSLAANGGDRCAGSPVGTARRARHAGPGDGGRARSPSSPRSPRGRPPPSGPVPGSSSWPAPAMPSPSSAPTRSSRSVREFLAGAGERHPD